MEGVVGNIPSGGHHEDVGEDDDGDEDLDGDDDDGFFATINCAKRCRGGDAHGENKADDRVRGEGQ